MRNIFKYFKKLSKSLSLQKDKDYSKRLLTKIVNNSLLMMWASYVLAWCGKAEIAEVLSKTIASSIIAVVVGYLTKSTIENISKYTTAFGKNVDPTYLPNNKRNNDHRDC